jgi:hypothetical protein
VISKKYSIIIVPPESGKVLNKEISQRFLVICSLFISLFIIASLYSAIGFIKSSVDKEKMTGLAKENEVLSAKLGNLESTVTILKSEMSKIVGKDENIRLVFDLPSIDSDIREVGVGGEMTTPTINSELGQRTWLVQEDIEKIRRQINLENASFGDIYSLIESKRDILTHTPTISPCDGYMTRGFGIHPDPFTGAYQPHNGVDLAAPKGTPVYATADGVVSSASYEGGLGNLIEINHGHGLSTCYGHLSQIMVTAGHQITRGELIGLIGSTGYSTGPHLHYEVHEDGRPVDPTKYLVKTILGLN